MTHMAVTVSELEPGEYHFTLLEAVDTDDDLLAYRPLLSDETAHESEMEAWIAGVCMLGGHLVRPVERPKPRFQP